MIDHCRSFRSSTGPDEAEKMAGGHRHRCPFRAGDRHEHVELVQAIDRCHAASSLVFKPFCMLTAICCPFAKALRHDPSHSK